MKEGEIRESTGRMVLACDPYWGSYIGKIRSCFNTPMGLRAKVEILLCVELPSQHAIFPPHGHVSRVPYKAQSVENFDACNIQFYHGSIEEGITLEDILKGVVITALEAKLGSKVSVSHTEWENAKREILNDIYANKFCFFSNVSSDYFINTMVDMLAMTKRFSAA